MKHHPVRKWVQRSLTLAILASSIGMASAATIIWEAFNDHRPGAGTSPNATGYDMWKAGNGGVLKDIATGDEVAISFEMTVEGGATDDFGANSPVNAGSPADKLFKGKVTIGNDGIPGIEAAKKTKLTLTFTGLDPAKLYKFRGTSSRGGGYTERWTIFSMIDAQNYVAAHEDGSKNKNIFTKATFAAADIEPNQVVLNTGDNKVGSLVGWDNIEPSLDGTFSIVQEQYLGAAPFGNPASGIVKYGYGFTAIYLAELESTGLLRISENPANQIVPAGRTATFNVVATSPQTIAYQWQRANGDGADFIDIPGANTAGYTTPTLAVADDGARFRCVLKSGPNTVPSGEATLTVDGILPSVASVRSSVDFTAVYVSFSEPVNLDTAVLPGNYTITGGAGVTVNNVKVLDPSTLQLVTSVQDPATDYTLGVSKVEDVAGNAIQPGTTIAFKSYKARTGTVGMELWFSFNGGSVAKLRADTRYPLDFDVDYAVSTFDSTLIFPSGPYNAYAGRFRAWLTPEETGDYEFFLDADDSAELRVSVNDESFENIDGAEFVPDAVDTSAGNGFQETGNPATSAPITLVAGQKYPVQVIWDEVNGNDYCRLAWRLVGDITPAGDLQPIDSRFLSYYGPSDEAAIAGITIGGGGVVIDWTGGVLESSEDLVTWTAEPAAAHPFVVSTPAGHRFYRAKP
jgi:hypothetical protein